MSISNSIVGARSADFRYIVDARWLMAYAAGIGDTAPWYFDTTHTITAHPLFPVCLEWDPIITLRTGPASVGTSAAEIARAVHAEHDLHWHRPIPPGTAVITRATAIGIEQRSPGAYLTKRIDTFDTAGNLLCQTYQGTLYRGVELADGPRVLESCPAWPEPVESVETMHSMSVPFAAAHLYTECARIWNPIHTDRAAAFAAGLPDIILHGTATLAYAVSAIIERHLPQGPRAVTRLGGRFSGMVRLPDVLTLACTQPAHGKVHFRVTNQQGQEVIRRGFLCFSDS